MHEDSDNSLFNSLSIHISVFIFDYEFKKVTLVNKHCKDCGQHNQSRVQTHYQNCSYPKLSRVPCKFSGFRKQSRVQEPCKDCDYSNQTRVHKPCKNCGYPKQSRLKKVSNCSKRLNFGGTGKPMGTIHLSINFNHPFYENIPVLERFYKPIFQKYVFCGPQLDKSGKYDIIKIPHPDKEQYGFYGFQCLVEAIRRHPGYTGYLYVNDDMIVNWWNFLSLDKTKIWFGAPKFDFSGGHVMGSLSPDTYFWQRANSAYRCSETFADMEKTSLFNKTSMFQIYFKNSNNRRICIGGLSDIFYIPEKHAKQFELIGQKFYDDFVFLEVSVPMSLILIDDISNMIFIDGIYLQRIYGWGKQWKQNTRRAWKEYNYDTYFLHPYKFTGKNRKRNSGKFQRKVGNISEEILRTKCLDVLKIKTKKI